MTKYLLSFESDFPPLYNEVIELPSDTYFFRGYDTRFDSISHHPSHFGDYHTAVEYSKQDNKQFGVFRTSRKLKVIDIRYLKILLSDLFLSRSSNNEVLEIIMSCTLAYGLCSFQKQIELITIRYRDSVDENAKNSIQAMKDYYASYLDKDYSNQPTIFHLAEAQGVRIAETFNDGCVLSFLSELFKAYNIHGFIAPAFLSPFHIEKRGNNTDPELVIFDPLHSGIQHVTQKVDGGGMKISVLDLIHHRLNYKLVSFKDLMKVEMRAGGSRKSHVLHNFEDFFNSLESDKNIKKHYKNARKAAKSWWLKTNFLFKPCVPHPTFQISSFHKSD